jgi:hypothetical protein
MDLCDFFLARKKCLRRSLSFFAFLALRMTLFQSLAHCLDSSDEIPFAQLNTAVPQDVVGRGAVEIKVRQHEMHQIGLAFETHRVFAKG